MKREQRRIEDLVELRARSRNESVTAVAGDSDGDVGAAEKGAADGEMGGKKGKGKRKGDQGLKEGALSGLV